MFVPRECWDELATAAHLYAVAAPDPFLDVHVAFLRTAAESGSAEGWRQELRRKYQRADLLRLRGSHAQRGLVTETLRAARRRTGNA